MSISAREMAQAILENIGGRQNVASLKKCATRIRFILKNGALTKEENLKKIHGLLGIIEADNLYYIIVEEGSNAKIYNELKNLLGDLPETMDLPVEKDGLVKRFKSFFKPKAK